MLRLRKGTSIKISAKNVYVVRGGAKDKRQRYAQAIGPWINPKIVFHPEALPESKRTTRAIEMGKKIFELRQQTRIKKGKPPRKVFEAIETQRQRVIMGKDGTTIHIYSSEYTPYAYAKTDLARQGVRRKILLRKGKLEKVYPHLAPAGAGVLSIGGK
ncbi:MAG: hypothetical protein AB1467_05690 [Candidatus Diapherotrites archaeon]